MIKYIILATLSLSVLAGCDRATASIEHCEKQGMEVKPPFAIGQKVQSEINPEIKMVVVNEIAVVDVQSCEVTRVHVRWRDPVGKYQTYLMNPYTLTEAGE